MVYAAAQHLHNWFIPHEGNNHHPHALRHKHLATYSALMIATKVVLVAALFFSFPTLAQFSTITQARLVDLANSARSAQQLPALAVNNKLTQAAQLKLNDMFSHGYFAHTSAQGVSPWEWIKQAGYLYTYAGENLAMNFTEAEDAHQAWLDSPTHRANILSANYNEIGIAVGVGELDGQQVTLVVQMFGKSFTPIADVKGESAAPVPAPVNSQPIVTTPIPAPVPEPLAVAETPAASQPISVSETVPEPLTQVVTPEPAHQPVSVVVPEPSPAAPQTIGQERQVSLQQSENTSFWSNIMQLTRQFYWLVLGFVTLALILKLLIRIKVQHKAVISHSLLVLAVGLLLLALHFHFLEKISGPLLIF